MQQPVQDGGGDDGAEYGASRTLRSWTGKGWYARPVNSRPLPTTQTTAKSTVARAEAQKRHGLDPEPPLSDRSWDRSRVWCVSRPV